MVDRARRRTAGSEPYNPQSAVLANGDSLGSDHQEFHEIRNCFQLHQRRTRTLRLKPSGAGRRTWMQRRAYTHGRRRRGGVAAADSALQEEESKLMFTGVRRALAASGPCRPTSRRPDRGPRAGGSSQPHVHITGIQGATLPVLARPACCRASGRFDRQRGEGLRPGGNRRRTR